jgi:RNA polymerase sigma-70 factor (ECF subfamily)
MSEVEEGPGRATDEELVDRVRALREDWGSFETLVRRHQAKVLANCRYLTRSAPQAEDLAQEVFIKAYFGLPGFEGRSAFKTWLHRLKVNHCLNFLSRRDPAVHVDAQDPLVQKDKAMQVPPEAESGLQRRQERERIDAVLDAMSDTLRIPLVMRDVDGLAYQEIADALGLGISAVKMRIKRAREEFRERYSALEPGAR